MSFCDWRLGLDPERSIWISHQLCSAVRPPWQPAVDLFISPYCCFREASLTLMPLFVVIGWVESREGTLISSCSGFDSWSLLRSKVKLCSAFAEFVDVIVVTAEEDYYCGYYDRISIKLFVRLLPCLYLHPKSAISLILHQYWLSLLWS